MENFYPHSWIGHVLNCQKRQENVEMYHKILEKSPKYVKIFWLELSLCAILLEHLICNARKPILLGALVCETLFFGWPPSLLMICLISLEDCKRENLILKQFPAVRFQLHCYSVCVFARRIQINQCHFLPVVIWNEGDFLNGHIDMVSYAAAVFSTVANEFCKCHGTFVCLFLSALLSFFFLVDAVVILADCFFYWKNDDDDDDDDPSDTNSDIR